MSSLIQIQNVSKNFGDAAIVQNFNLEVRPGEVVSLIGPSGCGKSTLLRLLSGLERNYSGKLLIDDSFVTGPTRQVGFMFQEPRLLPWLTVAQNILFGVKQVTTSIEDLLAQVQLAGSGKLLPRQLSGGMAQRTALARALAAHPQVLLLDEPFSAVDALTRMQLQELLISIWQRTRLTMLVVTHDIDEALYLSDRVIVLTARPATVSEVVPIGLARPRDRRDPVLIQLRAHLLESLRVAGSPHLTVSSPGVPFGV